MRKVLIVIFQLLLISSFGVAQTIDDQYLSTGWENIHIDHLQSPLHKMTGVSNHIWGTDYGGGFVYKSKDNGINWEQIAELGSEYFEAIQFLDTLNGFVCGDYGYVYKTSNGGESWQDISPPIDSLIKERFRGDTTKNQQPNGYFAAYYSMYFKDSLNGFVSGFKFNPKLGVSASFQRLFFQTEDGGENWILTREDQRIAYLGRFKNSIEKAGRTINGEYFLDDNNSWQVLRNNNIVHNTSILPKTDTLQTPSNPYDRVMLRSIVFMNQTSGYILGGSLDENLQKSVIYQTNDGGKHWDYIPSKWPHIHHAFIHNSYLWISAKEGVLIRKKLK